MSQTTQTISVTGRQYDVMSYLVTYGGSNQYKLAKWYAEEIGISIERAKKQIKEILKPLIDKDWIYEHREENRKTRRFEVYYIPTELGILILPKLEPREERDSEEKPSKYKLPW